jgi:uncharacterized membrane protein (DUF2068 family)
MLKIENAGILASSVFYAAAGIVCFIVLAMDFRMIHIGIIGIFSLITAYGLFKKRAWTIWLAIMLFFITTTFSVAILYSSFGGDLLLDVSAVAYLILTWVFTAYIAIKRKTLET